MEFTWTAVLIALAGSLGLTAVVFLVLIFYERFSGSGE